MKRIWIDHTCTLATDIDTAAALLRDVDGWSVFTPGLDAIVRDVALPPAVGSRFRMKLRMAGVPRMTLPAEIFQWDRERIEWGGGVGSWVIRHSMELRAAGPGSCELRHVEYATGLLALFCIPWERAIYAHDRGWSDAIEARFS